MNRCVLVTGASGMVGSTLVPFVQEMGYSVYATDIRIVKGTTYMDVTARDQVLSRLDEICPNLVIHLAAETDVDFCEAHPQHAHEVNLIGTTHVAEWCAENDAEMVYVSTAGVFDGEKSEPYIESDLPNPIMVYGREKLEGEEVVQTLVRKHFVVRAGWMIGGGEQDKKFVAKIVKQVKDGRKTIYAVSDRLGTPTYTVDFVRCLERLCRSRRYGLYHMACKGTGSRYDVAKEILAVLGREDIRLEAVPSSFFEEAYPAPRPKSEMLENRMLAHLGIDTMRPWREALGDYLVQHYDHIGKGVTRL